MARYKQFDPDAVLDCAMKLFWDEGYAATSVQDLVAAMQINRFSLYATFGDKEGLYLAACARYCETVVTMMLRELETGQAGLASVRRYFDQLVRVNARSRRGCLMVNSAIELALKDDAVASRVQAYFERVENAFYVALQRAKRSRELPPKVALRDHARHLSVVAYGLLVSLKGGAPPEQARKAVRTALAGLPVNRSRR